MTESLIPRKRNRQRPMGNRVKIAPMIEPVLLARLDLAAAERGMSRNVALAAAVLAWIEPTPVVATSPVIPAPPVPLPLGRSAPKTAQQIRSGSTTSGVRPPQAPRPLGTTKRLDGPIAWSSPKPDKRGG